MRKITATKIIDGTGEVYLKGTLVFENEVLVEFNKQEIDPSAEHFDGILVPGYINSHCHSELSHLHNKVPKQTGLHKFILEIEKLRKEEESSIIESAEKAIVEMKNRGIVAVGDICNSKNSKGLFEKHDLLSHRFIELFAFNPDKADFVFERGLSLYKEFEGQKSITIHSPYSASNKLIDFISNWSQQNQGLLSVHNQESEDENLLFLNKTGNILERLKLFGINTDFWKASGKSSLQTILPMLPSQSKILLVHNTFADQSDIDFSNNVSSNITWCLCPNANLYIENRLPNIEMFLKNKCRMVLGTDSLASNTQLSIFEEMKTLSLQFNKLTIDKIIPWACYNAALFFGWQSNVGSFVKGGKPGLNLIVNAENQKITRASESIRLL